MGMLKLREGYEPTAGEVAYCHKQAAMWLGMRRHADTAFSQVDRDYHASLKLAQLA